MIEDTRLNNWRLQGYDYFRIMAATGHKTMSMFTRYNTVSKDEPGLWWKKIGKDIHLRIQQSFCSKPKQRISI
jgi:hypothetical protein